MDIEYTTKPAAGCFPFHLYLPRVRDKYARLSLRLDTVVPAIWLNFLVLLLVLLLHGCGFARLDSLMVERNGGWVQTGGELSVIREGKRIDVAKGMMLKKDDVIETGPDTTATLRFEGDLIGSGGVILFPSTHIKILNPSLEIDFGKIFLQVKGLFNIHFEYGTAASEGTEYLVEVDAKRNVDVTVLEGVVKLSSKQNAWQPVRLKERQRAHMTRSRAPATHHLEQSEFNKTIELINRVWEGTGRRDISVIVPDLDKMSQSQAAELLKHERLRLGQITGRLTQRAKVGMVVGQQPHSNARVPIDSVVDLEVEAEPARVPDLLGLTQPGAQRRLEMSKLTVGKIEQVLMKGRKGEVVRQHPSAGTMVMTGSGVDFSVVAEAVSVPHLTGVNYQDAVQILRRNNLQLGRVDNRLDDRRAGGTVLEQHPSAGSLVDPQSSVTLILAEAGVRVPHVVGMMSKQAIAELSQIGLGYSTSYQEVQGYAKDSVIAQSVPASGLVRKGERIHLTLARVSPRCNVPNVTGQSYQQAVNQLQQARFNVSVQGRHSDDAQIGSQSPAAGQSVECGSTVVLMLKTPMNCSVPQLPINKASYQQAQQILSRAKLNMRATGKTGRGAYVTSQSPSAGTRVPCGSTVTVDFWVLR